jgi:transposase-like protein
MRGRDSMANKDKEKITMMGRIVRDGLAKDNIAKQSIVKEPIKCAYCGKTDNVEYRVGAERYCNKNCHYNFRREMDTIRRTDTRVRR